MAKAPQKPSTEKSQPDQPDEFASELAKRVGAVVGRDQAAKVVAQVISLTQEERFQGPIAHPKHLREYEEILPGSAERIVSMAEQSLAHSKKMQEKAIEADIDDAKSGRRYGFWALAMLIAAALVCALTGHEILAAAFLGAGALGTIGAFINGRNSNK